ncbi:4-O-methyl-glucuronoyl methylesterase 1-like [Nylanderia fulva]|uniref:4-O-methyl-glucuronoyl methylesterase 1-like n=1 Tax=Nylanderia fulva TaxID=613905 RepID=UPI0010FAD1A4|nr:4-O-methyl-glucuronoyl methylesterase 1-like [Nylanderia fulva]
MMPPPTPATMMMMMPTSTPATMMMPTAMPPPTPATIMTTPTSTPTAMPPPTPASTAMPTTTPAPGKNMKKRINEAIRRAVNKERRKFNRRPGPAQKYMPGPPEVIIFLHQDI